MPEDNNYSRMAIERLGVDPDNLGCVMLDVDIPQAYRAVLDPSKAYYSPKYNYVKGYEGVTHVTLLYGLLLSAQEPEGRKEVDGVLDGWYQPNVLVSAGDGSFDVFEGNDGHADYSCLIIRPIFTPELNEANGRLRKLPHVDGFAKYDPHITIGYVQADYTDEALADLESIGPLVMRVTGLNYGD